MPLCCKANSILGADLFAGEGARATPLLPASLLQFRILGFGFFQNWDIWIGIFP